jgi:hypothetical protein
MNSGQESKNSMYLATRDYLLINSAIMTPLPNYPGYLNAFQGYITQIQSQSEQQQLNTTGIADFKEQLRSTLITLAVDTSRKMSAFAMFTKNPILLKETRYTLSYLNRSSDSALRDAAQVIYDRAQSNLTALASYNITPETQTALLNAIGAFVTQIPKPRLGITEKKQATKQLETLFKQADAALDIIDALVEIVRLTQPNFYWGYKTARKIIEMGTGALALKGFVTDAATGEPLKGVTLNFCPECVEPTKKAASNGMSSAKEEVVLTKRTADKGGFNIKSLPEGIYKVTIKKNGYQEQVVTVAVTDGEMGNLNVELLKN